ncbi:TonB-dependent receptor [Pseudacidobacterium ailaaui]|uniref:TonB-dependent receptor n=1 Tax=Pseudacidobacterium ailaaui TaxID=1382359 RepID=UPI00047E148B|nr:TonB-dependent receptor [Pseudacidobacterium ailaaui]MBX6359527.1 TonB-dependent receptor [Pseudacidobacterium ailaaui]MCL6463722.1 TonB-dependent receptor [Pseudacidobacterium ailaaui]
MRTLLRRIAFSLFLVCFFSGALHAQSTSNSGTITGTVTDPTGAVVPGATVTIHNPVSQYERSVTTDKTGHFQFPNVPFNPYHLTVTMSGFSNAAQDVDVNSIVPVTANISLKLGEASNTTVVVTGEDLVENDTTMHTDIDRSMMQKLPLESQSSSISSLVTLASPGVAADSNGLFHGLGDHASNSFSVDGQPISDQQSKVFSNQIPGDSVQSLEVIDGAPPAEYGDKTSLVIKVTTRSGQGMKRPTGSINTSYGTFGSVNGGFDLGYGGDNWGNFIAANGLNTGRFLDPPEFRVFHAKGNEENIFDRVDYNFTQADSIHLNLQYTRSWFQTPNAYDNLNVLDQFGNSVGETDQKSKIETFNIAPTYTRLINNDAVFNFGAYARKDAYNYYPSGNPLADFSPTQSETVQQRRTLLNAGVHSDISYVKGAHNFKAGAVYEHTFLRENDSLGIVNPTLNSPCVDANGNPLNGFTDPSQCAAAGDRPNPGFNSVLLPYDLTRGGSLYAFYGPADIKELALYAEDQITAGNWLFNLGMRGDLYNGLTRERQAEPRLGASYSIKPTNTVLRVSYARTLETPFNENLVLSSTGCANSVLSPLLSCTPGVSGKLNPGFRNEFHAGFQQAFGKYAVVSGEYIWKYTHNAFDFSVLGNTPITFPIDWHNSKIPGFTLRADVPNFHNISAFVVMSSVAARFFPPQIGGAGATVGQSGYPFRIDHDERYNETTHLQYQIPWRKSLWYSFNWRYDSGLVAGSVPCYNVTDPNSSCNPINGGTSITLPNGQPGIDLSKLSADQQFQAGLTCDGVRATPTSGFTVCDAAGLTSKLVKVPAPGTENDDKNPPRIQPRSLFDMALGDDNLFHGDHYKWGLRLTAVNVTNKYALYNFLSTFSGTHYVTPRTVTGEVNFSF